MASISISMTQIFLGISLILSIFLGIYVYRLKLINIRWYKEKSKQYPQRTILFLFLLSWVLFRFALVLFSQHPSSELFECKELWLLSLIPLIIFYLDTSKKLYFFLFSLLLGAAITGVYNIYQTIIRDVSFGSFRVGGFWDTNNALTYTGITGIIYFIGVGAIAYFITQSKKTLVILFSILNFFVLSGFILSQSRSGYLAFLISVFFILICVFRRKIFFALPILFIFLALTLNHVSGIGDLFQRAKTDFIRELQEGNACGTIWSRLNLWEAGVKMWLANPIIGTGNGDYVTEHLKYKTQQACGVAGEVTSHLHNDYLNALVLFGSIGFSIFLLFYFLPLLHFIDGIKFKQYSFSLSNRTQNIDHSHWLLLGYIASIILMFGMGMFQCHFTDEEVQTVFLIAIGLYYREENSK